MKFSEKSVDRFSCTKRTNKQCDSGKTRINFLNDNFKDINKLFTILVLNV